MIPGGEGGPGGRRLPHYRAQGSVHTHAPMLGKAHTRTTDGARHIFHFQLLPPGARLGHRFRGAERALSTPGEATENQLKVMGVTVGSTCVQLVSTAT